MVGWNELLDSSLLDSDIAWNSCNAARVWDINVLPNVEIAAVTISLLSWKQDVPVSIEQCAREFGELMEPPSILTVKRVSRADPPLFVEVLADSLSHLRYPRLR